MKLNQVMEACGSRTSGGDPYQWNCYGDNAHFMEFRDVKGQGYSHCIFDTKTYDIYEIHLEVPNEDSAFRWLNPVTKSAYYDEAKSRNSNPDIAWDSQLYTDITDEDTILTMVERYGNCQYTNNDIFEVKSAKPTEQYRVDLDVRFEFDVEASSMNEAVEKARHFQKTMKMSWGEGSNEVSWIDTVVVKEIAKRELSY